MSQYEFRYLVFEVTGTDIRNMEEVEIGTRVEGRVGHMYAACDDFDLGLDIVRLLEKQDESGEKLQLVVFDTMDGRSARPAS